MSVLTREHCDDSELTPEEREHYRPILAKSLGAQHLETMRRIDEPGAFENTEEGFELMAKTSWDIVIRTNPVCHEISAISARRRREREESEAQQRLVGVAVDYAMTTDRHYSVASEEESTQ